MLMNEKKKHNIMTRLDYDVVFYRVFCVTLSAVAFTFIVILTNVFIDIDGLLSNKKKYLPVNSPITDTFIEESPQDASKDLLFNEDKKYNRGIIPLHRTKRSIESETANKVKSPAIKKMLSRRLASLLEQLDEEEAKKEIKFEITTRREVDKFINNKEDQIERLIIRNEDFLHIAMHNILLQGLIGHMHLSDVDKKVRSLMQSFNKHSDTKNVQDEKYDTIVNPKQKIQEVLDSIKLYNYTEDHKLYEEFMKCKKLEEQKNTLSNLNSYTNKTPIRKDEKVIIKTVIEINDSDNNPRGPNKTHHNENLEGFIKLIYNGKLIKVNQTHNEIISEKSKEMKTIQDIKQIKSPVTNKANSGNSESKNPQLMKNYHIDNPSPSLNKALDEYLKNHSLFNYGYLQNNAEVESISETQRSKRQINVRYSDNVTTSSKTKDVAEAGEKDDDDLYIEIETHFDGKGIKGEKKKKLVRNLIDKIQKALHPDIEKNHNSVDHIKFVKRIQDPIHSQNKISHSTKLAPLEPIEHRQLDPLSKTSGIIENIADKHGDAWKRQYNGPNFLSVSKSVNSAEMNELNVDYDSILRNGISKRLQKPLVTDAINDDDSIGVLHPNTGNVTLFLKDIGGSGFSIGFNQFEGEPPDKDSMKMFNGIENLIREYHKKYDQTDNMSNESTLNKLNFIETGHEMKKRNVEKLHNIYRRSITQVGANNRAQIYRKVFKKEPSIDKYVNILKGNHKLKFHSRVHNNNKIPYKEKSDHILTLSSNPSMKEVPITMDGKILSNKLRPPQTITIANIFNRERRSLSVKKISNLKSKIKLNRFINTKPMATKKVFLINKRNKRQVNNMRVIVKDIPKTPQKNSDENIFFISRENTYSDKETLIKAVETANTYINNKKTESYDDESPFDNIYRIQNPNTQLDLTENIYNTALRSNGLSSSYPHIFLDNNSKSKELEETFFDENQYKMNDKAYRIEKSPNSANILDKEQMQLSTQHNQATVLQNLSKNKMKEFVEAKMLPLSGKKFKITVKMSPKNKTNTNPRFKEIHTIVNKSFDENGLRYYTLLNVSQISKIEALNKTDDSNGVVQPSSYPLRDEQKQIKDLLKLHKKSVDHQLNTLLRESNNLEKMIERNKKNNMNKTIKLLTNVGNSLENVNEEILFDSVRKLQDANSTESMNLRTLPPTSKLRIELPSTTETPKMDQSLILDTIKRNEKVTFQILQKIDTNTQMLQNFLQEISKKYELDKIKHTPVKTKEKSAIEMNLDLSKNWKSYVVNKDDFFIPNELKNDTIPFVYAYQQSIPIKNRTPQLLASLVYHGHIHSNAIQNLSNDNSRNPTPKIESSLLINTDNSKRKFNESKFFLSELNNFNVLPKKDSIISVKIKTNTTKI